MNKNIIIYVFLGIIVIAGIIYLYISVKTPETPSVNPGTATTISCSILNANTIKTCNSATNEPCENCQCTSDPTVKMGCMTCQTIKGNSPILDIDPSACIGPNVQLINKNGIQQCILKDGSYCLPANVPDITCNPFSGYKVLTNNGIQYGWKCVCINDTKITNDGSGNCSGIYLCGMEGAETPTSNGRALGKTNGSDFTLWNGSSDWDPFTGTSCKCGLNEVADNDRLVCMPNSCSPGTPSPTPGVCICPPNYIDCQSISTRIDPKFGPYSDGICQIPSCVPDPCNPDPNIPGNNFYDYGSSMCVCGFCVKDVNGNCPASCTSGCSEANGDWTRVTDSSTLGETCSDLCANNGPCADRGTCYVYPPSTNNIWRINCLDQNTPCGGAGLPYMGISFIESSGSFGVIADSVSKTISLGTGEAGSEFLFEPECFSADTPCKSKTGVPISVVSQVFPTSSYYVKYIYNSTTYYVNFKNNTLVSSRSDSSLITLKKDSSILSSDVDHYKILIVSDGSYLSVQNKSLVTLFPFDGTARCKDCLGGRPNDSQLLCQYKQGCLADGSQCPNGDSDCCSNHCVNTVIAGSYCSGNY